jgi:SAM-dependent methyltransferase
VTNACETAGVFYGDVQARIHHTDFGRLAAAAAQQLLGLLVAAGHDSGTVYDLGSGSGILAAALTQQGYDVVGVDISPDMVALAQRTAPKAQFSVGSVHDVQLGPAVAVTATGEVLNYATDPAAGLAALAALAQRVHDVLAPGGVFLFDIAMPGRSGPQGRRVQFHDRPDWSLGMHAVESADGTQLDRVIVIFSRDEDTGLYQRYDEHHVLRLYQAADVERVVKDAGFGVARAASYEDQEWDTAPPAGWGVFVATKA